ncbi:MAG: hypothetical protein CL677_02260 [Bdellovibrionaceae bacterium]|nr:hypothetical protein [Pseudobdellovibrionaceae bacterium]|tara:strand:+ start:303 stop:1358 length:1056 start_codon:yes stop_codon:yes gene_type:complete
MNNGMEYLKGILDTLPDLIFVLDRNGIHIDFHSNFDDDLFVSPDEIRGKSVVDLLPKDVAELTLKNIEKTLREKTLSTFEYTLDFENEVKYFDARMTFLEESKVLVVVRNITEKKLMENELKESQKMELVGQIVSGISHDFNNILSLLYGNFGQLTKSVEPGREKYLNSTKRVLDRAKNLSDSLLNYVSKKGLQKEWISIKEALEDIEHITKNLPIGFSVEVSVLPPQEDLFIDAHRATFESSILNLIINSRDSIVEKGRPGSIEVHCETVEKDGRSWVVVSVADDGLGIPEDIIDQVTKPLFTTKAEGTGLGLSMIQRGLKEVEGHLTIDSTKNEGTRISLFYPLLKDFN